MLKVLQRVMFGLEQYLQVFQGKELKTGEL
jgi:hypothetical protein